MLHQSVAFESKPAKFFWRVALVTVLLAASGSAAAQQSNVSGAVQAFGNLTPEQQQAILQRLGGQSGAASGVPAPASNAQRAGNVSASAVPSPDSGPGASINWPQMPASPLFGAFDVLLLDVNLPGGKPSGPEGGDAAASPSSSKPPLVELLNESNPYKLDRDGVLQLPGFRGIELRGLNEAEATRRIAAEPALRNFEVHVFRLPVAKSGVEALRPYGYDLFASSQGMAPVTSGPVPAGYIVGAGDTFDVQLYGVQNFTQQLTVSRDGHINFPQLGPISVGGKPFGTVKQEIESRVEKQMIGEHASVSMVETRTIRVFVLGEVLRPGAYSVTGLANVTTALFAAGGVKSRGSLRRIEVRRHGALVREFDLYDLLMRGDSSSDVDLLPGDVVMVPTVGPTASIDGEVQRPAIYELKGATSVSKLIEMAGGLTAEADPVSASLVHVNADQQRIVIGVNPGAPNAATQSIGNGDILRLARLKPTIDSGITLQGYVYRPAAFAWRPGLRISDVIGSLDELKPNADSNYVLIRRVLSADKRISVLSADLAAALKAPDSAANLPLEQRDTLIVFDLQTGRERIIGPLMQELALQSNLQRPTEIVHIDGNVKVPGDYPLESGMRVGDLIRAGGSLRPSAYGGRAELSRFTVENGEQRRTEIINVDLAAVARGEEAANLALKPFDVLSVKEISGWTDQGQVTLQGEVRFPGKYAIQRGESLRSVIERAGGLTDLAFANGAVFTRTELRIREQQELDRLAERLKSDIAAMSLAAAKTQQGNAQADYSLGQSLLAQIKATRAVGRLVIDLNTAMHATPAGAGDIALRSGDQLLVPRLQQEVMVLGEVQSASSHLYDPELARDDYIAQSGGLTRQADRGRIYVVRADGRVVARSRRWLVGTGGDPMRAGDTVVVPFNIERVPTLPLVQSITQILYNIAIAAAAAHSLR